MIITKLIKQLNFIRIIFLSVIFINAQNTYAQDTSTWNEGPYLGASLIFNTINEGDAYYDNNSSTVYHYERDRKESKGIKIGYNKLLKNSFFVGPEFSYSGKKTLEVSDGVNGGVTDNLRFIDNYNIGLRGGYILNEDFAIVLGYGLSNQKIETSYVGDDGADKDIELKDYQGKYHSFGILFNLDNSYNLEISHQINSISSTIKKDEDPSRSAHNIEIEKIKSTSLTISKFF